MKKITVLTLNICFENPETYHIRFPKIIELVKKKKYEVACFQEVVPEFQILLERNFSKDYVISTAPEIPYFTSMICLKSLKPSFVRIALRSDMGRDLLYTVIAPDSDLNLVCGTVHLESLDNHRLREKQLQQVYKEFSKFGHSILVGDFNFPAHQNYNSKKKNERLHNLSLAECLPGYLDQWEHKYPDKPGYTFIHERNQWKFKDELRARGGFRFDRCMTNYKDDTIKVHNIDIICDEEIGPMQCSENKSVPIYLSDHLGLEITIQVKVASTQILDLSQEKECSKDCSPANIETSQKQSFPVTEEDEPSPTSPNIRIALILPSGKRVTRRFNPKAPTKLLFLWASSFDGASEFELKIRSSNETIGRSSQEYDSTVDSIPNLHNSVLVMVTRKL